MLFSISDGVPSVLDAKNMAKYLKYYPAGSSSKCLYHFDQFPRVPEGKFLKYDYGKEGNLKKYGTETPPEYNLSNVF